MSPALLPLPRVGGLRRASLHLPAQVPVLTPRPSPHGPWARAATLYTLTHTLTVCHSRTLTSLHTHSHTHMFCHTLTPHRLTLMLMCTYTHTHTVPARGPSFLEHSTQPHVRFLDAWKGCHHPEVRYKHPRGSPYPTVIWRKRVNIYWVQTAVYNSCEPLIWCPQDR